MTKKRTTAEADELLKAWRRQHDTPEMVAAAHRKVLLQRVVESMAFENEPVTRERLKTLLNENDQERRISSSGSGE